VSFSHETAARAPGDPADEIDALIAGVRTGRSRAIGRLLSLVEDGAHQASIAVAALDRQRSGKEQPWVVGVTGAPGVGKSTLVAALVGLLRDRGERVGVLAVDPSSPLTGGAVLGDRIRLQQHTLDNGVFVRSMATRGRLGGLATTTQQAVRVLGAAGFGVVVVETVGVGQSEVDVAGLADSVVLVLAPGLGDAVQASKAGVLEVADVLVVNKADHPGTEATVRDLRELVEESAAVQAGQVDARAGQEESWRPPVLTTVASSGTGVAGLLEALDRHRAELQARGRGADRRQARAASEVVDLALGLIRPGVGALAADVAAGRVTPHEAARLLVLQTARGLEARPVAGS
jgi:LAO/AO transport system kinase